jgi:hypothetical protein
MPAILAALLLAGCGGEKPEPVVPVAGKVMLEGQPLTQGVVSFRPDEGNATWHHPISEIDASGKYRLYTGDRPGAPPGRYKVLVFADANAPQGKAAHPQMPRWLANAKYTSPDTTDLRIDVREDAPAGAYDLKLSK